MFGAFLTIASAGQGTGLGLSFSHNTVARQHDGLIEVATGLGRYTKFVVQLPRAGRERRGIERADLRHRQ